MIIRFSTLYPVSELTVWMGKSPQVAQLEVLLAQRAQIQRLQRGMPNADIECASGGGIRPCRAARAIFLAARVLALERRVPGTHWSFPLSFRRSMRNGAYRKLFKASARI